MDPSSLTAIKEIIIVKKFVTFLSIPLDWNVSACVDSWKLNSCPKAWA